MDKDLGLSLSELPEPDHALPRRDLITEGFSDLDSTEREFVPVKPEQTCEIHKHALCRLRAEVPDPLGTRTDTGFEHQVESENLDIPEHFPTGKTVTVSEG